MKERRHAYRSLAIGAALAGALAGTALSPLPAVAVTEATQSKVTETQKQVEQSSKDYEAAKASADKLQQQIDANQQRIDELKGKLPEQRQRAGEAMRASYKNQQGSSILMSLVLQSESLDELLRRITYLDQIQSANTRAVDELNDAEAELEQKQAELQQAKAQADAEQQKASDALARAQELRQEAQRKADEEQAAEKKALEEAARQEAAKQQAAADPQPVPAPEVVDNSPVDWSQDQEAFVNAWAPRIDAYLAGSPLAGHGRDFAVAAWKYGVDPRFSPAISNTESGKGAYCYASYNAWGWGAIDFDSWEQAIDSHVKGLAEGYGYTISPAAAQKYCPPTWYHWYSVTLAEMNKI